MSVLRGFHAVGIMAWLGAATVVGPATAQEAPITGFSVRESIRQAELETALLDVIHPDSIGRWARTLASRPHVAGTEGQIVTRDSVIRWHRAAGLEARFDSLILYMPHPILSSLERTHPAPSTLDLEEPALDVDPATHRDVVPVFNAYSGNGASEAEVVFANYGLPADYRTLDSAGVSVAGNIVLVRYGRSFRGIKAREAETRGAGALLLYSDPASDGFVRGDVYPDGPMRPARGVQRGSILNATGDPSTPDGPSTAGSDRIPEEEMVGVAAIPVLPIGYGAAGELLTYLGGPIAPETWQGGLEMTYRLGPGPTRARVEARAERGEDAFHPAYNTIAVLPGRVWPEEWLVIGAHRDAWGPGAIDNVSGTAGVVEVARAFAVAAARGLRTRRTIVFATWDAEEWGVIGSIEWVEANAERLQSSVVAYVNLDAPVSGHSFGAASSPELKTLAREAPRRVTDPISGATVFEAWLSRVTEDAREGEVPTVPPVGDLGGGSDHKGFYQHLGIPCIGFGFGGRGGVYHSMYDTPRWMQEFGDPGYLYHAATARIAAVVLARMANAEILPFDHSGLAAVVEERAGQLATAMDEALRAATATQHGVGEAAMEEDAASSVSAAVRSALEELESGLSGLRRDGAEFAAAREAALSSGPLDEKVARRVNAHVREASLSFASESGLPGDAWSRQLLFASDPDNGYATLPLPAARLALRAGDLDAAAARVREIARHVNRAQGHLVAARQALAEGER
jgi:N-acetylated-alpha-linked acidic dipeptidase